jgi:hypothetical protein
VALPDPQPADPRRRARWGAIALLGVLVLVVAAILLDLGPFADDELSEEEFRARGDEICARAHERFDDAQAKAPGQTPAEAVTLTDELIGIAEAELDDLRSLAVPGSLKAGLDRYLAARERGIDTLHDGRAAAEDADLFEYEKAQADLAASQAKRLQLAREVGFTECSTLDPSKQAVEEDAEPPSASDPSAPPTVNNPPTGTP